MTEIYKASVIVSTYERPDALRAVLAGLASQTRTDFEVIVVDDGSGISTRNTVEETRPSSATASSMRGRRTTDVASPLRETLGSLR